MRPDDRALALKIARIRRRLKQRDVALAADLSASTVSDIESGWRRPTPDQLRRICAAIGINPDEIDRGAA